MTAPSPSGRPELGIVEWFRPGDHERVEEILPQIAASGIGHLRTHLSWAEFHGEGALAWYDWLLPRLAAELTVLPCIHYTPPSLSLTGRSNGPPRHPKDFADFVDHVLDRYGRHFRQVQLWNEPNNLLDWDWRADPDYLVFCEMVGGAAHWVKRRGWGAVLAGPCPADAAWLDLMGERGVLAEVEAIGVHGFPGTWDSEDGNWMGWPQHLSEMRGVLSRYNPEAEVWITETGHSTWRHDEIGQVRRFAEAARQDVARVYWYSWRDQPADVPVQEGLWFDPRHYHLGVTDAGGRPKLLGRCLMDGGPEAARSLAARAAPAVVPHPARPVVVTGGMGFIGANLVDELLLDGREVIAVDNLSRAGVERNLDWLADRHGKRFHPALADIRDGATLAGVVADSEAVVHFAAQTAVTTSLERPDIDFDVNLRGTVTLLEALRKAGRPVPLVFSSTNKVYGALDRLPMTATLNGHRPTDPDLFERGAGEDLPLDFRTPYGCSKGAADQYVLDYAESFGLPATVLRMSCVYGPRQFGTVDQGWVAHFLGEALAGREITIFGDGLQTRDILHVTDAVAAYRLALDHIGVTRGRAFNLGGGPANAVSLLAVLAEIGRLTGQMPLRRHAPERAGDQRWFVADTAALTAATGWRAAVPWKAGLSMLHHWMTRSDAPARAVPGRERLTA
jgi:CDP-paratose 2-epimerase